MGGPSPQVRGKHRLIAKRRPPLGSIPASAGETGSGRPSRWQTEVHPRECGGNGQRGTIGWKMWGPSPRVRGKPFDSAGLVFARRSIPASAGETEWRSDPGCRSWVHPRECGGNADFRPTSKRYAGPSPRVRGKPSRLSAVHPRLGSIPASAGETRPGASTSLRASVHPRECGGNRAVDGDHHAYPGPSPRVRGKRGAGGLDGLRDGSIPASAGETRTCRRAQP